MGFCDRINLQEQAFKSMKAKTHTIAPRRHILASRGQGHVQREHLYSSRESMNVILFVGQIEVSHVVLTKKATTR